MKNKPKIIIDTDPGHDDALALILLLKSNLFDVQAVTTVAGNADIEKVTRNAQAILDLIGSDVPIFSGMNEPLNRPLITAVVHGESGLDGFDTSRTHFKLTNDAPQRIIEIVRKFPGEVTLLTLGPLSNIARAFEQDSQLPTLVKEIVTMGGAINVPGNKNRVAEFNFFVDPEAAQHVFASSVKRTLIPLDACNDVQLSLSDFLGMTDSPLRTQLVKMMRAFLKGLREDEGASGILVYDALAAYFLLRPTACEVTPMNVEIETTGTHTSGMCVAEKRSYKKVQPNVNVVTKVDQEQFEKDFFAILDSAS